MSERDSKPRESRVRFTLSPAWLKNRQSWLSSIDIGGGVYEINEEEATTETAGWDRPWIPAFNNLVRAVVQSAPWTPEELTRDVRRGMLQRICKIFLDRSPNAAADGATMKRIIKEVQNEDPVNAVQGDYIAWMNHETAWKGADSFRSPDNFYLKEEFEKFRKDCDEKVKHRLHIINSDVSRLEARINRAIKAWDEIHRTDECFGNTLCVYILDVDGTSSPNQLLKFPRRLAASLEVVINGRKTGGEVAVRKAAKRKSRTFSAWSPPQATGLFLGKGGEKIDTVQLLIHLKEPDMCGFFSFKELACIAVPLNDVYHNMAAVNDPNRGRFPQLGMHFHQGFYVDPATNIGCNVAMNLTCLNPTHCETPPNFDMAAEKIKQSRPVEAVDSNTWQYDHHSAVKDLVDFFGDMKDGEVFALNLYCERYLVHEEMAQIAPLISAATKGSIHDKETRDLAYLSVRSLVTMRPHLKTKICASWVDSCFETVRHSVVDVIVAIENICPNPREGAELFATAVSILGITGIAASEISTLVDRHVEEILAPFERKMVKLATIINRARQYHFSVIIELEQREDKMKLVGKAQVLLQVVGDKLSELSAALTFAEKARHKGITAVAARKADMTLAILIPRLHTAVTALFAELAQSKEPDPLGDVFGMMYSLFQQAVESAEVFAQLPALEASAVKLVKVFESFLPNWFSLCREKLFSWAKAIVHEEPLLSIDPKRVFCNQAPGDANNLLQNLFELFVHCLEWGEAEAASLHAQNFGKLILDFAEKFSDYLFQKSEAGHLPKEWLVGFSSQLQFERLITKFWEEKIFQRVVAEFPSDEQKYKDSLLAVSKSLYEALVTSLSKIRGEYEKMLTDNYAKLFRGELFSDKMFCSTDPDNDLAQSIMEAFGTLMSEAGMAVEPTVAVKYVFPQVIKAVHQEFVEYVKRLGHNQQLSEMEGKTLQLILGGIEEAIKGIGGEHLDAKQLFNLSHSSRSAIHLYGLSSSSIIESLSRELAVSEKQRLEAVLRTRQDKEATKFNKKKK